MKHFLATIALLVGMPGMLFAGELQTLTMKIEGMTCGSCEQKVKQQLSSMCKEITVDLAGGKGVCKYETSITPDQIIAEANKTGFKTTKLMTQ